MGVHPHMTKRFKNYLIGTFKWMGLFFILNMLRATFENIFNMSLDGLRWGIWVFGCIVICCVVWRGYVISRTFDDESGGW
jgi:quinol-cytochrome oxidoreductase complex cytochrome b subunit